MAGCSGQEDRKTGKEAGRQAGRQTGQETCGSRSSRKGKRSAPGLWGNPDVPKTGWVCTGMEDLGAPSEFCGMCGVKRLRYIHVMEHGGWHGPVLAGCVCAGRMAGHPGAAAGRERRIRSKSRMLPGWQFRPWRRSAKGNLVLNVQGFMITVYRRKPDGLWAVCIRRRSTGASRFGSKGFHDEDAAVAAALDALLWARDRL